MYANKMRTTRDNCNPAHRWSGEIKGTDWECFVADISNTDFVLQNEWDMTLCIAGKSIFCVANLIRNTQALELHHFI
jgi:hypothetical protein